MHTKNIWKRKRLTPFKWFQTAGNKNKKNKITEKKAIYLERCKKKRISHLKNHQKKTTISKRK